MVVWDAECRFWRVILLFQLFHVSYMYILSLDVLPPAQSSIIQHRPASDKPRQFCFHNSASRFHIMRIVEIRSFAVSKARRSRPFMQEVPLCESAAIGPFPNFMRGL